MTVMDEDTGVETTEFDREREVRSLLEVDETKLGEIWRKHNEEKSLDEIAAETSTEKGNVSNYLRLAKSLVTGADVPASTWVAQFHLGRVRSWLRQKPLSPELRSALDAQSVALEAATVNPAQRVQEDEAAVLKTEEVERQGEPGVYVYTLPHYLRHRFEPVTGKTLLKVGHSSKDAYYRPASQGRLTALPEDPVLLRVYPVEESKSREVEGLFHEWLRMADHARSEARRGGSEWFVTSLQFLDHVAVNLGLPIRVVNEMTVLDE